MRLRRAGGRRSRAGDLDEQATAEDKKDTGEGQGEGWTILLFSCLLLGFKIC